MKRLAIALLATAAVSFSTSAQQSAPTAQDASRTAPQGKDPIGLTATQRQMIAWSIAGFADIQPVPSSFRPKLGAMVPGNLRVSQVPGIMQGVAPPVAGYRYAVLDDKDLLLVKPQDDTIADVIHLNRRL